MGRGWETKVLLAGPHPFRQFRTKDVRTGLRCASRACIVCGQFFLRRFRSGKELDTDGQRFVRYNLTPCEAEGKEPDHAETTIVR